MTIFSGHDLTCVRGRRLIFAAVSFDLQDGNILLLTGPNGGGKTSLLRIMAGLLPPASGDIDPPPALHWIGFDNALRPELTARQNLSFLHPQPWPKPALETMNVAPLLDIEVRTLSTGQRRRVALSRLFLGERKLWLLDEPTAGLDERHTKILADAVTKHAASDGMAVIATHDPHLWPGAKILTLGAAS